MWNKIVPLLMFFLVTCISKPLVFHTTLPKLLI